MTTRLDEIKARLAAATAGPWTIFGSELYEDEFAVMHSEGRNCVADGVLRRDAEFIAHARADIEWLIGELEQARNRAQAHCELCGGAGFIGPCPRCHQ